jgi:hypothetical protein
MRPKMYTRAATRRIYVVVSAIYIPQSCCTTKRYGKGGTYINSEHVEHWPSNDTSTELDKTADTADPSDLTRTAVFELMCTVVFLKHAEARREAQATEEDAKACESIEPGNCAAIRSRAKGDEVVFENRRTLSKILCIFD